MWGRGSTQTPDILRYRTYLLHNSYDVRSLSSNGICEVQKILAFVLVHQVDRVATLLLCQGASLSRCYFNGGNISEITESASRYRGSRMVLVLLHCGTCATGPR